LEEIQKYGVTVTSILLTAGVTIRVVVNTVTNALKTMGKALVAGLKDIRTKIGPMLPRLIGQVTSFLLKPAVQVVGYLTDHTRLLILAAVAFLFKRYLKKWC